MKKICAVILLILGVLAIVGTVAAKIAVRNAAGASLGIIGGADGPTAIIVSGSLGVSPVAVIVIGVILVATAVMLFRKK